MRHLCVMINTVLTLADKLRYDEWSSDRGVVSEAWRVYDRLNFHVYVCMFSIYKKGLIDITFVCVCVVYACVFYNPWGVSLCHQIRDSDQHAFEARRTSVKLIVPLHLRPALFFWGNNLSAAIKGRVWKEEAEQRFDVLGRSYDPAVISCCGSGLTLLFHAQVTQSVFHRRQNATLVKVQLPQTPRLFLFSCFLHTQTGTRSGTVTQCDASRLYLFSFSLLTCSLVVSSASATLLLLHKPCWQ